MSSDIFFSIITPTFNRGNLLRNAINSVQKQTFNNWELIVVDDGSTDHTRKIVLEFQKGDSRIRYHYQRNAERSVARNNGILRSKGEYICFLDSDDRYLPTHLMNLYTTITGNNNSKALFIAPRVFKSGDETKFEQWKALTHSWPDYFFQNPVSTSQVCIQRDIAKDFKFEPDITVGEDMILWIRIAGQFPVIRLESNSVEYFIHKTNSVNYKENNSPLKMLLGLRKFYKRYPETANQLTISLKRKVESEIIFNIAKHHLLNNRKLIGARFILQSIFRDLKHIHNKYRINVLGRTLLNLGYKKLLN